MPDDLGRVLLYLIVLQLAIDLFLIALIFIRDVQIDRLEKQVRRLQPPAKFEKKEEQTWTY